MALVWQQDAALPLKFMPQISSQTVVFQIDVLS